MKIEECKRRSLFKFGFIDPDKVHIYSLTTKPDETADNLLRFLTEQHFCDHILFPYNFKFHWVLLDIQIDKGIVEVRDPLSRDLEGFRNLQDMLQR